jgi:hypothetical protein
MSRGRGTRGSTGRAVLLRLGKCDVVDSQGLGVNFESATVAISLFFACGRGVSTDEHRWTPIGRQESSGRDSGEFMMAEADGVVFVVIRKRIRVAQRAANLTCSSVQFQGIAPKLAFVKRKGYRLQVSG